jgi:acyl carrier protein
MEHNEVIAKLTPIFREVFAEPNLELKDDMTAADVENWDSLTHMIMITKVEDMFGIKFKLRELNKLKNVGNLCDIIVEKLG